jgi:flagella basal body P-ring formation protein FlgA
MIRSSLSLAALATALLAAPCAFADAPQPVILKERLVAHGPAITLGDLFDNAGEAAGLAVARAPQPGGRVSIDPAHVQSLAAQSGLSWANAGGVLRVTVERAARIIPAAEVEALIEEMLFVETGKTHQVSLSSHSAQLAAPLDSLGAPEVVRFEHDAHSGLFRADVAAWPGGQAETLAGRAEAVSDLPVLARPVARGQIISASDIEWVQLPESRVRAEHVSSEASLIGMAARRALRPGEPLREFDIEAPTLIARGEIVSLVFRSGALTLAARARAMEDGAEGELIRFVNLQSNRTVEAVAEGAGRARVVGPAYTH